MRRQSRVPVRLRKSPPQVAAEEAETKDYPPKTPKPMTPMRTTQRRKPSVTPRLRFRTLRPQLRAEDRRTCGPGRRARRSPSANIPTPQRLRASHVQISNLSEGPRRIEHMFDTAALTSVDSLTDEAELIGRIAELERLKSAAAAGQARAAAALDERRRAGEAAQGVPATKRGRGLASEVALARRDSPSRGNRHLGFAKALVHEMPHTLGRIGVWRALRMARHTDRARVGLPQRRGPPGAGCRNVRRCQRPRRKGRRSNHRGGQGDRVPTGCPGGG